MFFQQKTKIVLALGNGLWNCGGEMSYQAMQNPMCRDLRRTYATMKKPRWSVAFQPQTIWKGQPETRAEFMVRFNAKNEARKAAEAILGGSR